MPLQDLNASRILAAPHLSVWARQVEHYLQGCDVHGLLGFASSGSSGLPPKAILFTPKALNICAQGAIEHLGAQQGDWVCALPTWHVGGAMIHLRAQQTGAKVYTLSGKWNVLKYAQLLQTSEAWWSALVPTQVIDIVQQKVRAPETLKCVIVGGATLSRQTGEQARDLGWPVVQSYGMTESGSQLATALPHESFRTDNLQVLSHWQVRTDSIGRLSIHGTGQAWGQVRTLSNGQFELLPIAATDWYQTNDIVHYDDRRLSFIRRADRLVKILGELVDPDAIQNALSVSGVELAVEPVDHERNGAQLIVCGAMLTAILKLCIDWNQTAPGPERITGVLELSIPKNTMGKIDRGYLKTLIRQCENSIIRI